LLAIQYQLDVADWVRDAVLNNAVVTKTCGVVDASVSNDKRARQQTQSGFQK
jgi:hypothetical protein